jgi:hypothetical protein
LTAALLERLAPNRTRLRHFSSPQHIDSALYPTIGKRTRAGFTRDDTWARNSPALDALLAQACISSRTTLFADMLSLPNDGRYPALDLTATAEAGR